MTTTKTVRFFVYSAGVVLLITGLAKWISSAGGARILETPDPLLTVPFRQVFWVVGGLELVVAMICLFTKRVWLQNGLVAWLGTNFVVYRLGLLWIGYHRPCSCMGNLTDALGMSPKTADLILKIVLGYLVVGSYAVLYSLWRSERGKAVAAKAGEGAAGSVPEPV